MAGIQSWGNLVETNGSMRQLCLKAGVDPSNVSRAKHGKQPLSLAACKKLAEVDPQINPTSLYLQSVARVAKSRIDGGGDTGPAGAIAAIRAAVASLESVPPNELLVEGSDRAGAVEELNRLLGNAFRNATPASGTRPEPVEPVTTKSKRQDSFGRVAPDAGSKVKRDLFGRAMPTEG